MFLNKCSLTWAYRAFQLPLSDENTGLDVMYGTVVACRSSRPRMLPCKRKIRCEARVELQPHAVWDCVIWWWTRPRHTAGSSFLTILSCNSFLWFSYISFHCSATLVASSIHSFRVQLKLWRRYNLEELIATQQLHSY